MNWIISYLRLIFLGFFSLQIVQAMESVSSEKLSVVADIVPPIVIVRKDEKSALSLLLPSELGVRLAKIKDNLITNYLESNPMSQEPVIIELPVRFFSISPLQLNDFFILVTEVYSSINLADNQNVLLLDTYLFDELLKRHVSLMMLGTIQDLQKYLGILYELADFFGYEALLPKLKYDMHDIVEDADKVMLYIGQTSDRGIINTVKALFETGFLVPHAALDGQVEKLRQFERALFLLGYEGIHKNITEVRTILELVSEIKSNKNNIAEYNNLLQSLLKRLQNVSTTLSESQSEYSSVAPLAMIFQQYFSADNDIVNMFKSVITLEQWRMFNINKWNG